jgi:cysteinyl-tRNA synthetase
MCEDLNTSVAVAKMIEGIRSFLREDTLSAAQAGEARWFLDRIEQTLGMHGRTAAPTTAPEVPEINGVLITKWIEDRAEAKRAKDFARADDIRKQIEAAGFELRDTPQGTEWKRLAPG